MSTATVERRTRGHSTLTINVPAGPVRSVTIEGLPLEKLTADQRAWFAAALRKDFARITVRYA